MPSRSIDAKTDSTVFVLVTRSNCRVLFAPVSCNTRVKPAVGSFATTLCMSEAYNQVIYGCTRTKKSAREPRTTCFAILWRYLSFFERWLIHDRMKFFVKRNGSCDGGRRCKAFWNTWNPQCLRSGEDDEENNVSKLRMSGKDFVWPSEEAHRPLRFGKTPENYPR